MRNRIFRLFNISAIAAVWALVLLSAPPPAKAAETNLLLITIDTLRPDRLSCYDKRFVKTPAIDALAAKGVLFEQAFAHNPITLASHANILLGTTPLYHGVSENAKSRVSDAFLTLAEHLKSGGYATGAFVGAFPLDHRFGLSQGFDVYDDAITRKSELIGSYSERKAEQVVTASLAWLTGQKGKWFCWIHLWDPHAPYDPPEPYLTEYQKDPYSGEAAYVDAQLARIFAELKTRGWSDRTLVVLTADHGESLGEHGELTHSYFAYNSTLHVPLILAGPGIRAKRAAEYVSHVDIFPTVCDLLNVKRPASTLQGESLMPLLQRNPMAPRPIYFESLEPYLNKGCAPLRGFIEGGRKFMDTTIPEVYDLGRDFEEKTNLAPQTDLNPLKKTMRDMEERLSSPMKKEASGTPDRRTMERLRSLGYVAAPVAQLKTKYGPEDDLKSFLPYQQMLERAIILLDLDKAAESIKEANMLIGRRKDFSLAYLFLSQTLMKQGRARDAIRVMDEAVKNIPGNYSLLSGYGLILVQTAQHQRAADVLQEALSLFDFEPEVWDNLGIATMRNGDLLKALEYFDKAIALDKSFALAYANKGAAYFEMSDKPENLALSIESFRRAVALEPAGGLAWRGLGFANKKAGKLDEAVAAWEKAVIADPADEFSTLNLGLGYMEKNDKSRARRCFLRYLEIKGDRITAEERDRVQAMIDKCR